MKKTLLPAGEDRVPVTWCTALLVSAAAWAVNACQPLTNLILAHKLRFAILLGGAYGCLALYLVLFRRRRDCRTLVGLLLTGSFLMRAAYILHLPYDYSPHDLGSFAGFDVPGVFDGHLGYIEYLFKNRHLPDFDPRELWSFSNPPGFHILAALLLGLSRAAGLTQLQCYESLQVLPLLFANLTVLSLVRLVDELSIRNGGLLFTAALLSVHPFFTITAGTLNNDSLMACLMALAMLYTVRWWKEPSMRNILVIALALGGGMAAKLNAATAAFGIGAVFLWVFWQDRAAWKKYAGQFAAFLAVCAPLGLFWPVRNMLKYNMPLLYIQKMDPNSPQRVYDTSLSGRLGLPTQEQLSHPFSSPDLAREANIWVQTIRTSLFDEISATEVDNFWRIGMALLLISLVLALVMNAAFVWSLCKKGTLPPVMKLFLGVSYGVMLLTYLKFCLDEPFYCTMNYRYIPLAIVFPCMGVCLWLQRPGPGGGRSGVLLLSKALLLGLAGLFCLVALLFSLYLFV